MKACPICGGREFLITAHISETWLVDENGEWIETKSSCNDVVYVADNSDPWTCNRCGYEADGGEFETGKRR